ncbi:response regulator, partial [bacterium]|nr:response regulator [bacterium]
MINDATILIVDDTKDNINILLSLLDDFDLLVALNGKKALSLIQKHDVDLILLDIMMPDMDGYEVCQKLKSQEETKDIPILFITAKTDEKSIEKAFESGGMDFVTKPFKPKELLARVKIQLELRKTLKALEFAATRDSMTGIYNRREFFIRGKQ